MGGGGGGGGGGMRDKLQSLGLGEILGFPPK